MTNSPNWVSVNLQLGYPKPGTVDGGVLSQLATTNSAAGTAFPSVAIGTVAYFRDIGTTQLGGGGFIYLPGVTATVQGDVVVYRTPNGAGLSPDVNSGAATIRWTGTGNTGFGLAVATAAVTDQSHWGWYQIQGSAIVNVTGTVSAGQSAYWGQTGTILTASAAGGKQVDGMQSVSANGAPLALSSQAVFTLANPTVQSQIT